MKFNKEEMIDKLYKAKDIISEVFEETEIFEVGGVLCDIDEAVSAVEKENR